MTTPASVHSVSFSLHSFQAHPDGPVCFVCTHVTKGKCRGAIFTGVVAHYLGSFTCLQAVPGLIKLVDPRFQAFSLVSLLVGVIVIVKLVSDFVMPCYLICTLGLQL